MQKYEAAQCKPPNGKWCVFFDGVKVGKDFDDPGPAEAEAERLQKSWNDMAEHAQKQQAKVAGAAEDKGYYIGPIHHADEDHALQCYTPGSFVIHRQAALSAPLVIDQRPEIRYREGRGSVAFKTIEVQQR